MEKILKQEEIDRLFRAAQKSQAAGRAESLTQRSVQECDFRQAGQLTRDQVRQITSLHEAFAPNLSNALAAYLRVGFNASLVAVEQLVYSEFLGRLSEQTYFATVALMPLEELAAIQIDLPLIFPMIDLLLGGPGQGISEARDLTEIEQDILESVVQIICRELQSTWQIVVPIQFRTGERLQQAQIARLMPAAERVLNLSFEIQLTDMRGNLNFVFPGVMSNLLLRKLAQQGITRRRRLSSGAGSRLRDRVLEGEFTLELELPAFSISIRDIVGLRPGKIVPLRHPVRDPMLVSVNGVSLFSGSPVKCGPLRGGLMQELLQRTEIAEKDRS